MYEKTKKWVPVLTPLLFLMFVFGEHEGIWDKWRGLDSVIAVAERFETSYENGIDRRVEKDEEAFEILLELINKYSLTTLPPHKRPTAIMRLKAIQSSKIHTGPSRIAEWTAPSTPIILIFGKIKQKMENEDVVIVGTIGDLRDWVEKCQSDLRFFVSDVAFTVVAFFVALGAWSRQPSLGEEASLEG